MTDDNHAGDGAALYATRHPLNITPEMIEAGEKQLFAKFGNGVGHHDSQEAVGAIYTAMADAAPPEPELQISDDALEIVEREFEIDRWLDISTAPRDGTRILAGTIGDDEICTVEFINGRFVLSPTVLEGPSGGESLADPYPKPTHWQPLPPSGPKPKLGIFNNG